MSNAKEKALGFPLNRSLAKKVTIDEMKERNKGDVFGFLFKDRKLYSWNSATREASNKAGRIENAWRNQALKYGLCLFCFGQTISYKDATNFYFTYCIQCSDDIWNSRCLACSQTARKSPSLFCLKCFNLIDDKELRSQFNLYVTNNDIQEVTRELRITEPQRCSLCDEIVAPYLGIFCSKHVLLNRNFEHYKRKLYFENKCNYCETPLPPDISDSKTNSHICTTCTNDWKRSLEICFSCGQNMDPIFNGVKMDVRYEICITCVVKRSEIAERWEKSESVGERAMFEILGQLYGKENIYRYIRPTWLLGLELDFYVPSHKLAFEFDGLQHYEYIEYFHRSEENFEAQRKRDVRKDNLCHKNGIRLIRIKYDFILSNESLKSLIDIQQT